MVIARSWLLVVPTLLVQASFRTQLPALAGVTVRGEAAPVVSVQPGSVSALPPSVAVPVHDAAPVTLQATVNGLPMPYPSPDGVAVSAKLGDCGTVSGGLRVVEPCA